ncbi:MAG: beta galactosidase jelly roll domain-containing protein [Bacteroidia bacterium]
MFKKFPPFLLAALLSGIIASMAAYFLQNTSHDEISFESFQPEQIQYADEEPEHLLVRLKGEWLFTTGDDRAWAETNADDSDWQSIWSGKTWEEQGYDHYDGFAWYRKRVVIADTEEKADLFFKLGGIDDAAEIFVNGKLVASSGAMPPNYETGYLNPQQYRVSQDVINWGKPNVIAIRVYDGGGEGGLRGESMGIYTTLPRPKPDLDLAGTWEFITEPKLDELGEDAIWSEIKVPGIWENQGYENYDGFAWYRKTITLPNTFGNEQLVLLLGRIDDLDEVYVDGKKIASTGAMTKHHGTVNGKEWKALRGYYIPEGIVQIGKPHEIAVRIYDGGGEGGIYEGPIGIISQSKYVAFWKKHRNRLK